MTINNSGFHWNKEDYFPYLIKDFKQAVLALEYLGKLYEMSSSERLSDFDLVLILNRLFSGRSSWRQGQDHRQILEPLWLGGLIMGSGQAHVLWQSSSQRQLGLCLWHHCWDSSWHRTRYRSPSEWVSSRIEEYSRLPGDLATKQRLRVPHERCWHHWNHCK